MSEVNIVLNLGTPRSSSPEDVGSYLSEFLMDPYVIKAPKPLRWLFVNLLIVPKRKFNSSTLYKKIWTKQGSPLQVKTDQLASQLSESTGKVFYTAYRYADPANVERDNAVKNATRIQLIPLYPQYAESSYRSAVDDFVNRHDLHNKDLLIMKPYFKEDFHIQSLVNKLKPLVSDKKTFVFSYHGLPENHLQQVDYAKHGCNRAHCCDEFSAKNQWCYKAQCLHTTRLLSAALGLRADQVHSSFQSRLGPVKWILPSTESVLQRLGAQNADVVISSPSFTIDCLETIYEIKEELREAFVKSGGQNYQYVDCLNEGEDWVEALSRAIEGADDLFWSHKQYDKYVKGKVRELSL